MFCNASRITRDGEPHENIVSLFQTDNDNSNDSSNNNDNCSESLWYESKETIKIRQKSMLKTL